MINIEKRSNYALYFQYKNLIKDDLFLFPYGDHGIAHTKRVLYLSSLLAEHYSLNKDYWEILAFACCYHDIGRVNDLTDPDHGQMSVEKCKRLQLDKISGLSVDSWKIVELLIEFHSIDDNLFTTNNSTINLMYQIIKDADAIDRLRFNDLDEKYLRLEYSKEIIPIALEIINNRII